MVWLKNCSQLSQKQRLKLIINTAAQKWLPHFLVRQPLFSQKETTNPNPSPTGKKFGFVLFGTIVLIGLEQKVSITNNFL